MSKPFELLFEDVYTRMTRYLQGKNFAEFKASVPYMNNCRDGAGAFETITKSIESAKDNDSEALHALVICFVQKMVDKKQCLRQIKKYFSKNNNKVSKQYLKAMKDALYQFHAWLGCYLLSRMGFKLSEDEMIVKEHLLSSLLSTEDNGYSPLLKALFWLFLQLGLHCFCLGQAQTGKQEERVATLEDHKFFLGTGNLRTLALCIILQQDPLVKMMEDADLCKLVVTVFPKVAYPDEAMAKAFLELFSFWKRKERGADQEEGKKPLSARLMEAYLCLRPPSTTRYPVLKRLDPEEKTSRATILLSLAAHDGRRHQRGICKELKLLCSQPHERDELVAFIVRGLLALAEDIPEKLARAILQSCGVDKVVVKENGAPTKILQQPLKHSTKGRALSPLAYPSKPTIPSVSTTPLSLLCQFCDSKSATSVAEVFCSAAKRDKRGKHTQMPICQSCWDLCVNSEGPTRCCQNCPKFLAGGKYRENAYDTLFKGWQPSTAPQEPVPQDQEPAPQEPVPQEPVPQERVSLAQTGGNPISRKKSSGNKKTKPQRTKALRSKRKNKRKKKIKESQKKEQEARAMEIGTSNESQFISDQVTEHETAPGPVKGVYKGERSYTKKPTSEKKSTGPSGKISKVPSNNTREKLAEDLLHGFLNSK